MKIINLIDSLTQVNFGIWNAAIATATQLKEIYKVESYIWYPAIENPPAISDVVMTAFAKLDRASLLSALESGEFKPESTLIVTHGCWKFPTRWGAMLKNNGYKWVMVPHGMLEPWSMQQKRVKKLLYFHLIEKRLIIRGDAIRAVGTPESKNLKKLLNRDPVLIPNGIPLIDTPVPHKDHTKINYLFMARLHHKKGVIPMVKAWIASSLANNSKYSLTIAGPDDGELSELTTVLKQHAVSNIRYTGAVYNNKKEELLNNCHFYLLPSHSEGFPTSILEAMQYGLIPLITEGCNFPEAFDADLAIKVTPYLSDIQSGLEQTTKLTFEQINHWSSRASNFVNKNYNLQVIAEQQYKLYSVLMDTPGVL